MRPGLSGPWRPTQLQRMMRAQEERVRRCEHVGTCSSPCAVWPACTLYTEIVGATRVWMERLPETIEAFYVDAGAAERWHTLGCETHVGRDQLERVTTSLLTMEQRIRAVRDRFEQAFGVTRPLVLFNLSRGAAPFSWLREQEGAGRLQP